MMGIAWASCWPSAFQAARDKNPIPMLLGAICALLPDTLDHWISRPLHKPDIHIVSPPEAPAPFMIAEALAHALLKSHNSKMSLTIVCYPMPLGPERWLPYQIQFDSPRRQIAVHIPDADAGTAIAGTPVGFISNPTNQLLVHSEPRSLRLEPLSDGRVSILAITSPQRWSHSLLAALAIGSLAAGFLDLTSGLIAGGAYGLHILTKQLGFSSTALLWPFSRKLQAGFQWITPRQSPKIDFALLWLSLLLLAGNIIRATSPAINGPSLLQLLLFGGAIPLAMLSFLRLNQSKSDEYCRLPPPHTDPPDQGAHTDQA